MSDLGESNNEASDVIPVTEKSVPVEHNLGPDMSEFPIPVRAFTNSLIKSHDEVWSKLLQLDYRGQAHTPTKWREILAAMKQREV